MKKSLLIVVGVTVVIAAAIAYLLLTRDTTTTEQNAQAPQTTTSTPSTTDKEPPASTTPGTYRDYDKTEVANTSGRKILFFYAPWCPQCRALEKSIQAGTLPAGVTIFKTDFDSELALRQQYGVTLQTTLVEIDGQGNKIQAYTAYDTPNLDTVIKEMKL